MARSSGESSGDRGPAREYTGARRAHSAARRSNSAPFFLTRAADGPYTPPNPRSPAVHPREIADCSSTGLTDTPSIRLVDHASGWRRSLAACNHGITRPVPSSRRSPWTSQPPPLPDHHRRPRRHPGHRHPARAGPAAPDLLPLLEQLRPRLRQEAGRDRPALHQGHGHQDPHRPHRGAPAGRQVRLRGPDAGRPRPRRDAHALPVALRAAARGRLRPRGRAREEVRGGAPVGQGDGQRQGRVARGAAVSRLLRGRLPRGPLQEGRASRSRTPGKTSTRSARS